MQETNAHLIFCKAHVFSRLAEAEEQIQELEAKLW